MEDELGEWIEARAWTTGDGPKALFDAAVVWLRERRVLLPGVSTLVRLVAARREAAAQRLWSTLHELLDDGQRTALDGNWAKCQGLHPHHLPQRLLRTFTKF